MFAALAGGGPTMQRRRRGLAAWATVVEVEGNEGVVRATGGEQTQRTLDMRKNAHHQAWLRLRVDSWVDSN